MRWDLTTSAASWRHRDRSGLVDDGSGDLDLSVVGDEIDDAHVTTDTLAS
jgi:hypothetical protein